MENDGKYNLKLIDDLENFCDPIEYYTKWKYQQDCKWLYNVTELNESIIFEIWFEIEILDYFDVYTPDGNIFPYSGTVFGEQFFSELNTLFLGIIDKERYYSLDECNIIKIPIMVPCLYFAKLMYNACRTILYFRPRANNSLSIGKGRFGIKYSKNFDNSNYYVQNIQKNFCISECLMEKMGSKNSDGLEYIKYVRAGEIFSFCSFVENSLAKFILMPEHIDIDRIILYSQDKTHEFTLCGDNIFYVNKNKWDGSMMIMIPSQNNILKCPEDLEYLITKKIFINEEIDDDNIIFNFTENKQKYGYFGISFYFGNDIITKYELILIDLRIDLRIDLKCAKICWIH
jgi:hypothetical protein